MSALISPRSTAVSPAALAHPPFPEGFARPGLRMLATIGGSVLLLTLLWDFIGLDLPVMRWFGGPRGFPLEHDWWLEYVLHTGVQRLCWALYAALWIGVFRPWSRLQAVPSRRERLVVMAAITAALLAVAGMKQVSLTSCPTMLREFGGPARHVSHWAWGIADGGPGHCFPGGHVSSALAFVALALPFLDRPGRAARRLGLGLLAWIVGAGLVLGLAQTLRGQHYPSHTLWTLLVCLAVTGAVWTLLAPRTRRPPLPAEADVQGQVDRHADEDGAQHGLAAPLARVEE